MKSAYRVLVADDDPAMLRFLVQTLEPQHYACDTAADGLQAAQLLAAKDYDLLISDLEMPGNEDLRLIRDLPQIAAGLPVILITGYPTVATAIASLQLPVAAYLTKPCPIADLVRHAAVAVQGYETFRAVQASHQRSLKWQGDLAAITDGLRNTRTRAAAPWTTLMNLTLQNITAALQDFQTFAGLARLRSGAPDQPAPATANGPLLLLGAVRETIAVLEHTRGSFKSKELGELRKRLELLLSGGPA
ncbi:MAG: response regulator [Verrucomicrobiota bacterium]